MRNDRKRIMNVISISEQLMSEKNVFYNEIYIELKVDFGRSQIKF